MACKITCHAEHRVRERVGLPKKAVKRATDRALTDGISHKDVTGGLRRYMECLYNKGNGEANNIRLYGDFIYLFHNHILITVYNVPPEHRKQAKYLQRKERKKNGMQ